MRVCRGIHDYSLIHEQKRCNRKKRDDIIILQPNLQVYLGHISL